MDNVQKKTTRSVGLQAVVSSKEHINPKIAASFNLETLDYPNIFTIPRSLSALVLAAIVIYTLGLNSSGSTDECGHNFLKGVIVIVFIFAATYFPDSIVRRPHPVLWRLVLAASLIYLIILLYILFLTKDQARQFLTFFDKNLNTPLPEKDYGVSCTIFKPQFPYIELKEIVDRIDIFITSHLLGWYVKMLAIRDFRLCMFLSVFFEIIELTFRHILPNFIECWWDHLFLDILGCNFLGIIAGYYTIKLFNMKKLTWIREKQKTPTEGNILFYYFRRKYQHYAIFYFVYSQYLGAI